MPIYFNRKKGIVSRSGSSIDENVDATLHQVTNNHEEEFELQTPKVIDMSDEETEDTADVQREPTAESSRYSQNGEEGSRATIATVPEWFERRFDRRCRLIVSCVMICVYVFAKLGASIFAMQVILHTIIGSEQTLPITIGLVLFTAVYTALGGTRIVMYTDVLQLCIFFIGGLLCLYIVTDRVGDLSVARHDLGINENWHIIRPADDAAWPFLGYITGNLIMTCWFWCVGQEIVQRVLCARNEMHARKGTLFASLLKMFPMVEEKFTRNFRVNREMREKICVYDPILDEF